MSLENLLEELRGAGTVDSSGSFSLDLRHGLEKLRRHQLLDKNRYGLLLMAAASRRGAGAVEIVNDADDFIFSWLGEPLSRAELEDLFRLDGAMLPLGLALLSAQALKPRFIRVDSGENRLEIRQGALRLVACPAFPGLRLQVRERYGWRALFKYLGEWLQLPPESRLIARHCAGLGTAISINGRALDRTFQLGPCALVIKLVGQADRRTLDAMATASPLTERRDPVQGLLEQRWEDQTPVLERPLTGDYHAIAAVGPAVQNRGLTIVAQGIRFAQPDAASPDPFLSLTLVRPTQRIDLSYTRVVQDEALAGALETVQGLLDETLAEHLSQLPEALLGPLAARFQRRQSKTAWTSVQARRLQGASDEQLGGLLRECTPAWLEPTNQAWGPVLQQLLQRLKATRQAGPLSLAALRALLRNLEALHALLPGPAVAEERALLHAAAGDFVEARALLDPRDHRSALLDLWLDWKDPALPETPLARGLLALKQDHPKIARAELASSGDERPVVLDLRARLEARAGEWDVAHRLTMQAAEQSAGLARSVRLHFALALLKRRFEHALPEPGNFVEDVAHDLKERGTCLWSSGDSATIAYCQSALARQGDSDATSAARAQLGAAHPFTRALAWTVADRRLQLGLKGFELIVPCELLAFWGPEGFQP